MKKESVCQSLVPVKMTKKPSSRHSKKQTLVSIVLLNHEGEHYLKRTIPAIQRLSYPNREIIVVDNGSTDGSLAFLSTVQDLQVIRIPVNKGYSAGKNLGVKAARGKYVFLLDDDILIDDQSIIEKLMTSINDEILAISLLLVNEGCIETKYYGGFYALYGLLHRLNVDHRKILAFPESLVPVGSPDGGALFFKRDIFLETGGYDTSQPYLLDVGDWGVRAALLTGKNSMLFTKSMAWHIGHARKEDIKIWCWKFSYSFCGMIKIILKNYTLFNVIKTLPFVMCYQLAATVKNLVLKRNLRIVLALAISICRMGMDFAETLKKRSAVQKKRLLKKDFFLHVRPPFAWFEE